MSFSMESFLPEENRDNMNMTTTDTATPMSALHMRDDSTRLLKSFPTTPRTIVLFSGVVMGTISRFSVSSPPKLSSSTPSGLRSFIYTMSGLELSMSFDVSAKLLPVVLKSWASSWPLSSVTVVVK